MIPADSLTGALTDATRKWRALGDSTTSRFADWTTAPTHDNGERGGGNGHPSDDRLRDLLDDRQAARYQAELAALANRLYSDLHRLVRLVGIAHPDQPRVLQHRDLTAAQLVADGWCPSCFRDDGNLTHVAEGRYTDRCRVCGEHRAATHRDPSLDDLRIMHARGKRPRQRSA